MEAFTMSNIEVKLGDERFFIHARVKTLRVILDKDFSFSDHVTHGIQHAMGRLRVQKCVTRVSKTAVAHSKNSTFPKYNCRFVFSLWKCDHVSLYKDGRNVPNGYELQDSDQLHDSQNTGVPGTTVFYIEENVQAVVAQVIIFQRECGEEFDPVEDKDKVNMIVNARIACFRVVFLNFMVMSLLDFLNKFSAAQAAIIEASAAAAEAAKANVQLAYDAAFRMLLNIELKAPIIVIPANSRSGEAIVLDLGDMKIKNHLSDHIVTVENEDVTVLMDNLNLALENLTMSRYARQLKNYIYKLKGCEEKIESMKTLFHDREKELSKEITLLKQKLKREKIANENIILHAEEEISNSLKQDCLQSGNCMRCVIYKEETKKMLETIQTLESIIKILQRESSDQQKQYDPLSPEKFTCLNCFPPLNNINNKQKPPSVDNKWQEVSKSSCRRKQRSFGVIKNVADSDFTSENSFAVLQNDSESEKSDYNECTITSNTISTPYERPQSLTRQKTYKKVSSAHQERRGHINIRKNNGTKQKLLLCADSHGRDLTFHLNKHQQQLKKHTKSLEAVGFIRPGGLAEQILNFDNIDGEELGPDDVLAIACGSNDVSRNEAQNAINAIKETIVKYNNSRVVLMDLPFRHDLQTWSCVNEEVRQFNKKLETISQEFPNVYLVKLSRADRHVHTQHGMHLNVRGKHWLAGQIWEALDETKKIEVSTTQGTAPQEVCASKTDERSPNSNAADGICATAFTSGSEPLMDGEKEMPASLGNCLLTDPAAPP
ncbi:hypothetical protein J6590_012374 [Homalodisca vitripennis]|nr:hypothetical protein J6590_012374 [Homalodisca vitripennis]